MRRAGRLLVLPFLLAGCLTRELPPARLYTLQPPGRLPAVQAASPAGVLRVAPLRASRPYTTTRLLYTRTGIDREHYAFSRWSDAPVRLLPRLLADALDRSGLFRAVLPPGSTLRGDLELEGSLLDFTVHLEGERPRAVLEARFLLATARERRVLASRRFRLEVPMDDAGPEAAARGLDRAAERLAGALVRWLAEVVPAAR